MNSVFKNLSPLHFGWSKDHPPINGGFVAMDKSDIVLTNQGPEPTDEFVKKMATSLIRTNEKTNKILDQKTPAIAAISSQDLERVFDGNINEALKFYNNLGTTLLTTLKKTNFKRYRNPSKIVKIPVSDGIVAEQKDRPTTKKPHFDPNGLVVGHFYFPTKNVEGGNLRVFDIKQYLHDHPGKTLNEIRHKDNTGSSNLVVDLQEDTLDPYGIEIPRTNNGPLIVFINNTDEACVAHGVTPISILDQEDYERRYQRISLTSLNLRRFLERNTWRSIGRAIGLNI